MRLRSPLAFAALALAAGGLVPAAASAQVPTRKPGWWEMTMSMSAPTPMKQKTMMCTDAATEKANGAFANAMQQGNCTVGPIGRTPAGWTYSSTCKMGKTTMASSGVVTGDFNSHYRVDSTTRMTPAPMPRMTETRMSVDAKWLGPCPAGRKPGDMVMANGMVMNVNRK